MEGWRSDLALDVELSELLQMTEAQWCRYCKRKIYFTTKNTTCPGFHVHKLGGSLSFSFVHYLNQFFLFRHMNVEKDFKCACKRG